MEEQKAPELIAEAAKPMRLKRSWETTEFISAVLGIFILGAVSQILPVDVAYVRMLIVVNAFSLSRALFKYHRGFIHDGLKTGEFWAFIFCLVMTLGCFIFRGLTATAAADGTCASAVTYILCRGITKMVPLKTHIFQHR